MGIDGSEGLLQVESTLPKPWEQADDFHDTLYDWMGRAPWLAISTAAHLVIFLIIQAVPWALFERQEEVVISATIQPPREQLPLDPPPEPEHEILPEVIEEDPVVQVDLPVEDPETDDEVFTDDERGDPEMWTDSQFTDPSMNNVLGIGPGGLAGKYGNRGDGGNKNNVGPSTRPPLDRGLRWLAAHQDLDGSWDADGFMKHDPPGDPCTGPGDALHDVGLTGLALLAFLGDGNTLHTGRYRDVVTRGVRWLRRQQDLDNGLLGEAIGHTFLYDHAIASLALGEAYYFSHSPLLRNTVQLSMNYIQRARNPYGAWRYDVPPTGDNDTSVTGWMIFALESAREAGLQVESDAFLGALTWIDEVTDPATGRVGYDSPGSVSSRVPNLNDHYPPEHGETMTAVGLLCRFFLGQDPKHEPIMTKHADLLLRSLPEWDP
ncbi:MAG: prenyltransferase/squalene oxidase repeat-containing protein, partial [Planctomycetota bacterium]